MVVELAKRLGCRYCDLESIITEKTGMTINRIVELFGERHLRDMESRVIARISFLENPVISSGGGDKAKEPQPSALSEY